MLCSNPCFSKRGTFEHNIPMKLRISTVVLRQARLKNSKLAHGRVRKVILHNIEANEWTYGSPILRIHHIVRTHLHVLYLGAPVRLPSDLINRVIPVKARPLHFVCLVQQSSFQLMWAALRQSRVLLQSM